VLVVRHTDFVIDEAELEEAARSGDANAQFALARLLLDGPRAAADGYRGLALIEQASTAGDANATALQSLFVAMGVSRPPDWERAFDLLALAAEQGSVAAQGQLKVLAPEPHLSADGSWSDLRRQIDLGRIFRKSDRKILSKVPRVAVTERFASPAECSWLIERSRARLASAEVIDTATGAETYVNDRSNSSTSFQLIDMDLVLEVIRARIAASTGAPLPWFEVTQVLHYAVGQEFRPHFDFLDPDNAALGEQLSRGQRLFTFLIYLNEGFEGGETRFLDADLSFKGRTGDGIYWANVDDTGRPDRLTRHAGLPPGSGEKWILSQWIRDRNQAG
jgi:hypothetical protein